MANQSVKILVSCFLPDGENVVLKKMKHDMKEEGLRRLWLKEIKFLGTIQHPNVVRLLGVCMEPVGPVLEYVQFDLGRLKNLGGMPVNPIGHNLFDFLEVLDRNKLVESVGIKLGLLHKAAVDVAKGLESLHSEDICHRDLKPDNVLVTNDARMVVCKITDFGEARSMHIQTPPPPPGYPNKPDRVSRGTTVFRSPEQLSGKLRTPDINSLKKIDIWGYGMILFCLQNPDLKYPWYNEIREHGKDFLHTAFRGSRPTHRLPEESETYRHLQDELGMHKVYRFCCSYTPNDRPDMNDVLALLG